MAGWNLKCGELKSIAVNEEKYWSLFNYVFSDACRKRNTYKFGFIKSILDNLFNMEVADGGMQVSYEDLFAKFVENYWNLVVKYNLKQMRKDGKSDYSKVELILKSAFEENEIPEVCSFDILRTEQKEQLIKSITSECKKYVVGALYEDFDGLLYGFDLKHPLITINYYAYEFMLKYKSEIEKLNYYSWAKFLESVNQDNVLVRVIDKLELATPRRRDLTVYRELLRKEFEEDTCFYCGKKLQRNIHVDHFIPWSFIKDDKAWNFVLSCPNCNERKSNHITSKQFVYRIENRNHELRLINNNLVQKDFSNYKDDMMLRLWEYAKLSGLKEYIKTDKHENTGM